MEAGKRAPPDSVRPAFPSDSPFREGLLSCQREEESRKVTNLKGAV